MAHGGDVHGRKPKVDKDSVDECKLPCCVCIKRNIKTEADKYCSNCLNYFCEECVKIHDLLPSSFDHVIVDKAEMGHSKNAAKVLQIPTQRCADHRTKIVDMFCKTHHQVGCTTCIALHHNSPSCDKLYIPENIEALFRSEDFMKAEKNLSTVIQELKDAIALRSRCQTKLKELKDQASEAMNCYMNEILTSLSEMKKETKACLEKLFLEVDALVNDQTGQLKSGLCLAEDVLKDTQRSRQDRCNESQQFVCCTIADTIVDKCLTLNKNLDCPEISSIIFTPYVSKEELLRPLLQLNTLGTFEIQKINESENCSPYKVQTKRTVNIQESADKKKCDIRGSCSFPDGKILLPDCNNHCLKRVLPHQSSVSDHLDLPTGNYTPWSVCVISEHEAAVTLPDTKQVQFVSIKKNMKKTSTIKLDYKCYGIVFYNGELFVSDNDTTVYVYTTAGKLLRQFSKDKSGDKLFSYISNITVSESGRVLYVADWYKGLIAVDTQTGHKVWQYTADDLKFATDVCVDGRGSVFVCGGFSKNVLQISESGEKIAEMLTRADGISDPRSLCFLRNTNELVISGENKSKWFTLFS